ncbi:invasion associated locus B family protein [Roseibium sediminis]|uniref:invasion associated locus B family protein n=1 Tax=Roseibium sediminis TaxID=1775174 RepID=UPI00123DF320|nr:invasion associated locus B family protein [Roseibium sediminis]
MHQLFAACLWCALLLSANFASAVEPTAPSNDSEVFSDWQVTCVPQGEGRACQMVQTAAASKGGQAIFLLSISRGQEGVSENDFAVMTVPVGVYLAPGIEIRVDNKRPFKVLYEVCDRAGCHAGFKLSGVVLTAFQKGIEAKVRVWTARSKAVEFPVSLRGFSNAYRHYRGEVSQ